MGKANSTITHIDGFEFWYTYNDVNLRITDVEWTIPENVVAHFVLYDTDVSAVEPRIDTYIVENGTVKPTGQWRMELQDIDGEQQLALPPNILYNLWVISPAGV